MAWTYLFLAGLLEIGWAIGLKYTDGFTRPLPTVLTVASMIASLALLGLALRTLPVGTAYAVWTGLGAVGTVFAGALLFGESLGAMRLGGLVRHILRQVPALRRLRLSSIDQVEADPDLLAAIAEDPRLMPHLHLSLQSGDDLILRRMKRRHTRADAVRFCEAVRRLRPDVTFGADLIAGFPTETEEMFINSLRLIDDCGLTYLHVFPYSRRAGTPAERMPQVAGAVIKDRAARLRVSGQTALAAYMSAQVGREAELLMERRGVGRTPQPEADWRRLAIQDHRRTGQTQAVVPEN